MGNDLSASTADFFQRSLSFVRLDRIRRSTSNGIRRYRSASIARKSRTSSVSSQDAKPNSFHSDTTTGKSLSYSSSASTKGNRASVRRSKSWRCSPTVPDPPPYNIVDSSKSSPGTTGWAGTRGGVRSPDLLVNSSTPDDFDEFFEQAAGRSFINWDNTRTEGFETPPDSPPTRPRSLKTKGHNYEGQQLFLRVPSPTSDDLTSSTYSGRSIPDSIATSDDQSAAADQPAKLKLSSSSSPAGLLTRKSSSFRRESINGVSVRFAEDESKIMSTSQPNSVQMRTSLSPPSNRLSPPSSSPNQRLSPSPTPPASSASKSPNPNVRSLKQSISTTELQKKRRADERRKTIATTPRAASSDSPTAGMNDKKSPSTSRSSSTQSSVSLLTPAQITLIRQHWNQTYVSKGPTVVGTHVFQRACFKVPAIKEIFNHVEFTEKLPNVDLVYKHHAKSVALLIDDIVKHLDHLDAIIPKLAEIGRKHSQFHSNGFQVNFWAIFAESFIDCTLEWGEKIRRVEEARKAWAILIAFIVDRMKVGYQDGKRDMTRIKISGGDSTQSDGCGSPPR